MHLQCICKACARVLLGPEERTRFLRAFRSARLERAHRAGIFKRILEACKKRRACPHCGALNCTVKCAAHAPSWRTFLAVCLLWPSTLQGRHKLCPLSSHRADSEEPVAVSLLGILCKECLHNRIHSIMRTDFLLQRVLRRARACAGR